MNVLRGVTVLLGWELHHCKGKDVDAAKGEAVPQEWGGGVGCWVPLKQSSTRISGTHNQFGLLRHWKEGKWAEQEGG